MADRMPSGNRFRSNVIALSVLISLPGLATMLVCLWTLLELTSVQWRMFAIFVIAYASLASPLQALWQTRYMRPIAEYLDRRASGQVDDGVRREAFRRVMALPRFAALMGFGGWLVPVVLICVIMDVRWAAWGLFEDAVLMLSGSAAGFVSGSFLMYLAKTHSAEVREALAEEIPDSRERASLIRALPMRTKLLFSVTGVTVVPVIFAVLLFQAMAGRSIESFTLELQGNLLEAEAMSLEGGGFRAEPSGLAAQIEITALEISSLETALAGTLEEEVVADLGRALEAGLLRGDSARLPSRLVFSWRRIADGRMLLATLPASQVDVDSRSLWTAFGLLFAVSLSIATMLAHLLSSDVSRATEALRGEAERLASGDLSRGRTFESEDELGELSRSFEGMSASLRSTVRRVAEAADRVEGTAMEMARVSASVAEVTADQVSGIQQTSSSMEAINGQVRGIADSAQGLNVSVEESSSSILELGAAGEELNETASVLSERVNEVSSSIEQMVRSVKQVLENTEALGEAAVETSSSMGEMAASMREVDASAEETARLSREVVDSAESGQRKMVETIKGMEAIREATETAEQVIRSLGGRASEIGAIVDVIDDVADETNLLALNAAIIAAQAGEHGRAFGVVADEIKDLADRVLASTKEIGSQIRAVQEESTNAIGAIEQGSRSVAQGVDRTAEAGVSLEGITQASRESGERIAGIVSAVREQARAASHVVELMERVREGVEEIRRAAAEQDRGNEVVSRGSVVMRDVASQVRGTTEEQARGSGRIRESIEGVREAVERIHGALQEQTASCRSALEFLEAMHQRTQANEDSAKRLDHVGRDLVQQAEALREHVQRFRTA